MIEIQHRVQATVAGAELARSQFRAAVRRFNDDPTVANFERYRREPVARGDRACRGGF